MHNISDFKISKPQWLPHIFKIQLQLVIVGIPEGKDSQK